VVFEPREDTAVVGVRFANLVLGEIGGACLYGRIRPTAYARKWGQGNGVSVEWHLLSILSSGFSMFGRCW
jgi:hypothetical protein